MLLKKKKNFYRGLKWFEGCIELRQEKAIVRIAPSVVYLALCMREKIQCPQNHTRAESVLPGEVGPHDRNKLVPIIFVNEDFGNIMRRLGNEETFTFRR